MKNFTHIDLFHIVVAIFEFSIEFVLVLSQRVNHSPSAFNGPWRDKYLRGLNILAVNFNFCVLIALTM